MLVGPSTTVNNIVEEVRSLRLVPTLYRTLASLMALAALAGVKHGGTPLGGVAVACDALAIPSDWTSPIASWVDEHAGPVAGLAVMLLTFSLLVLPKRRDLGWDLAQTLEWRAPSTAVLSFVLLVQCGYALHVLPLLGLFAFWGVWEVTRGKFRYCASDHVLIPVVGIFLAVLFAPVSVAAWCVGRDAGSAPYFPAGLERE